MKLNERSALLTPKILLVPYSQHHVPTYHTWMQDPALQAATASDPLTLDQEYAMQKSWRTDADKLTFIACTPPVSSPACTPTPTPTTSSDSVSGPASHIRAEHDDTPSTMIGDVNLFLTPTDEEEDPTNVTYQTLIGEVEIMIASKEHQGQGLGRQILLTFLWYVVHSLDAIMSEYHNERGGGKERSQMEYLRVKIDKGNSRSIALFASVGFRLVSEEPNYFGELELRLEIGSGLGGEMEMRLGGAPRVLEYKVT